MREVWYFRDTHLSKRVAGGAFLSRGAAFHVLMGRPLVWEARLGGISCFRGRWGHVGPELQQLMLQVTYFEAVADETQATAPLARNPRVVAFLSYKLLPRPQ